MDAFGVRIEMLSRFRSRKEQKDTLDKLAKGDLDIVIGTHRLIQPDVHFKDLGLLIIDEEQRFGVARRKKSSSGVLASMSLPCRQRLFRGPSIWPW